MGIVSELRTRPHMRHAYIILIDGCPFAFTDEYELTTQSGSGWWDEDDRRILPGLQVPHLTMSVDWDTGLLRDNAVSFKLLDTDGETLPRFFGAVEKSFKLLGMRLTPTEDPAPASTFDHYGDALTLWTGTEGSYLGTEAIGPNGERHYYSCLPWLHWTWPGEDHGAVDDPMVVHTTAAVGPYIVEGRRVALLRLAYDEDTGTWPSPQDQYEGGALLWWGKLRSKGKVDGRTWSISCAGPSSWLVKTLNSRAPTAWYKVSSQPDLPASQRKIKVRFFKKNGPYGFLYKFGQDDVSYTIPAGPLDVDTVTTAIQTAITAVKGLAGDDGVWTDDTPGFGCAGGVIFLSDSVSVWTSGDGGFSVIMTLGLHWSIWRLLGYDPEMGLGTHEGPQPQFSKDPNDPKYYFGSFSSTPFGNDMWTVSDDVDAWDGDGAIHVYNPLYPGGLTVLPGTGAVNVKLIKPDGGFDPIYCEGQTIRPPKSSVSFGGLDCNATRWWVFKGKIQRATGLGTVGEPEDFFQVAKCSWVSTTGEPGLMYQSDGLNADLYIEQWLDPKFFGFKFEPIDPDLGWAGTIDSGEGAIMASPLAHWGAFGTDTEDSGRTLHRILTSTGTATWDGVSSDTGDPDFFFDYNFTYLVHGVNHGDVPPGEPVWGDADIADLGLAIPYQMVDYHAFSTEEVLLPPSMIRGKSVAHGPVEAEELIQGVMAPRDWAMRLHGLKFGVFRRTAQASVQDADVVLQISDLAGDGGDPASTWPEAELRGTNPIDRITLRYCADPIEGPTEGQIEVAYKARDLGARARAGRGSLEIQAPDLRAREWWKGPTLADDWTAALRDMWEREVCTYMAQPNRLITLRVSRPKGQDMYPGTLVAFTDPRPVNSSGGYGYTNAVARVLSVTHEADSCCATVDLLVQAAAGTAQVWAPIARVIDDVETPEERYDPETRTFYLKDWIAPNGATYGWNSRIFEEPGWSSAGGHARFWVLQYDGVSWTKTCEGYVESVFIGASRITHTEDGLVGTFYPRMYAVIVMAPYDDVLQAAWVKSVFALLGPINGLPESVKMAK